MYISQDAHEVSHNRMHKAIDKLCDRNSNSCHAKGDRQDHDEGFNQDRLRRIMLDQLHLPPYSAHPSYHKTMTTAWKFYFWLGMKKDIATYIV